MRRPDLRIGIDVGGTNTDAVLLDARRRGARQGQGADDARTSPPASAPRSTRVLAGEPSRRDARHPRDARHDARHERRPRAAPAARVAVLRLGAPATRSVRPLLAWPDDLRARGARPARRSSAAASSSTAARSRRSTRTRPRASSSRARGSAEAVAISGVVLAGLPDHELRAARPRRARCSVTTWPSRSSHEIGSLGPDRARERLRAQRRAGAVSRRTSPTALRAALADHGLDADRLLRPERRHADGPRLRGRATRC